MNITCLLTYSLNKVDDFGTFLAQSVHEDVVLYILVLCVSYI